MKVWLLHIDKKGENTLRIFRKREPAIRAAQEFWDDWTSEDEHYHPLTHWIDEDGWVKPDTSEDKNPYYEALCGGGEFFAVIYHKEVE